MSANQYTSHAQVHAHQTVDAPIRGRESEMVQNDSGAFVFLQSDLAFFERFLILGSIGGAYHCGAQQKFDDAMDMLIRLRESEDAINALDLLMDVSITGRAPKNDPAIFALAVFSGSTKSYVKKHCYRMLSHVCRTATHLFTFMEFVKASGRGYGRGLKKAVGRWYSEKSFDDLCYQVIKYRNRSGWTHRDVLRKVRPKTADARLNALFKYICYNPSRKEPEYHNEYLVAKHAICSANEHIRMFHAVQEAKGSDVPALVPHVVSSRTPWEALPTEWLKKPEVWEGLSANAPMGALMRNLGRISGLGLTSRGSNVESLVASRFSQEAVQQARLHPINILMAMKTYASGRGLRGSATWPVSQNIVGVLDQAFYYAFKNVEATGKRFYLGIDISASMTWEKVSGGGVTPIEGAAAMALVTLDAEPTAIVKGFSGGRSSTVGTGGIYMTDLPLSTSRRLDDNVRDALGVGMGATILSAPIEDAIANNLEVDVFVIYTDNETNCRFGVHPMIALDRYRQKTGIDAKLIVVGMEGRPFTIADPKALYTMDIVGFDASCPELIATYSRLNTKFN